MDSGAATATAEGELANEHDEHVDERHEWHRRGMLHPADIEALVHRRLAENLPHDPVYADFFGPVSRPREPDRER